MFQAGHQTANIMLLLPLGGCGNCTDADTDVEPMLTLVIQLFSYSELIQSFYLIIINIHVVIMFSEIKNLIQMVIENHVER